MDTQKTRYDYEAVINELSANNIDVSDAYIYADHRLSSVFELYFQFCQDALSKRASNIGPSRFYFSDSSEVNATAFFKRNDFYRISVNRGTVEEIHDLLCNNNVFDDPDLEEYKGLDSFFRQSSFQTSLDYIALDQCLIFIFYHELGHLNQFSNMQKGQPNVSNIEEKNIRGKSSFNILFHVMEIDADRQAANHLGYSIWASWSDLPSDQRTISNLRKIIIISLVSVLSFFIMLLQFSDSSIYFYEGTHPHPIIRLSWILKHIVDNIKYRQPDLEDQDIMGETLRVLNVYSKHKNLGNVFENYIEPYRKYHDDMGSYLYSLVETARTPGYEFLSK